MKKEISKKEMFNIFMWTLNFKKILFTHGHEYWSPCDRESKIIKSIFYVENGNIRFLKNISENHSIYWLGDLANYPNCPPTGEYSKIKIEEEYQKEIRECFIEFCSISRTCNSEDWSTIYNQAMELYEKISDKQLSLIYYLHSQLLKRLKKAYEKK